MNLVESTRQALAGMQKIERAIIEDVRARKIAIAAANFTWNRGGSLAELRDPVHMEVRLGSQLTSIDWLLVCLQDSRDRIDRFDVRAEIKRIVSVLAPT
jgi:hypothetical protein